MDNIYLTLNPKSKVVRTIKAVGILKEFWLSHPKEETLSLKDAELLTKGSIPLPDHWRDNDYFKLHDILIHSDTGYYLQSRNSG
ncbi:MAG: hypothetical protein VW683_10380 [Betaproteobacteria bacterium]